MVSLLLAVEMLSQRSPGNAMVLFPKALKLAERHHSRPLCIENESSMMLVNNPHFYQPMKHIDV
jgi:hypothetical protein